MPVADLDRTVSIARVELVRCEAMIFAPKRNDFAEVRRVEIRQIEHPDRIRFLQRNPGRLPVVSHGDVLGLEVLGHGRVWSVDAHAGGTQVVRLAIELIEPGSAHDPCRLQLAGVERVLDSTQVDDAHRTLWIDRVADVRLRLVRHEHGLAVGRERDHVGQRPDLKLGETLQRLRIEEHDFAGVGLGISGKHHGDEPLKDRNTVRVTTGLRERPDLVWVGGIGDIEHIDALRLRVHDEQSLAHGIMLDDLGSARATNTRVVTPDRAELQLQRGIPTCNLACRRDCAGCNSGDEGCDCERQLVLLQSHCSAPLEVNE